MLPDAEEVYAQLGRTSEQAAPLPREVGELRQVVLDGRVAA